MQAIFKRLVRKWLVVLAIATLFSGFGNIGTVNAQDNGTISSAKSGNLQKYFGKALSDEEVHFVILQGDVDDVRKIILSGYDINKIFLGGTPLITAIKSAVRGPKTIEKPEYALQKVKILVEAGADVNRSALMGKATSPLNWALTLPLQMEDTAKEVLKIVEERIKNREGLCDYPGLITKPCKDITPEEEKMIKKAFQDSFSISNRQLIPHYMKIVDFLVNSGADVNAKNIIGQTALHTVAGIPESLTLAPLKYLLENGADVNVQDSYGNTPLFFAYGAGNKKAVNLLVSKGADINIKNHDGVKYNQVYTKTISGDMDEHNRIKLKYVD